MSRMRRREVLDGYLFIAPWLIGFLVFTLWPVLASFYLSFCRWNLLQPAEWVGLRHYQTIFSGQDPLLIKSLWVTTLYTAMSVPLNVALSIAVALLLNQRVAGIGVFRTIYYLPAVTSGVAVAVLWMWIFHLDHGLLNVALGWVGIAPLPWLEDERLVIPAFVMMGLWSVGGNMILYLAGLQAIPVEMYEAAEIDGASATQRLFRITLPLLSPVIFFNLVMAVIGSFQVFTQSFIMTSGGPNNGSLFYVLYLFNNAFQYFKMGYACAMAWLLFLIILALTLIQLQLGKRWVHYEAGEPR